MHSASVRARSWLATSVGRRFSWSLAWLSYLFGIVARYQYALKLHQPRHHVISDARQLTDLAERLLSSPASQSIYDTVWPPGASAIFALLLARDPTAGGAAFM